jgi:hypothetical protein
LRKQRRVVTEMIEIGEQLAGVIALSVFLICVTAILIARWHFECKYEKIKRDK